MNNIQAKIKAQIMKRIFRVWFVRSMVPLLALELLLILLGVYFFSRLVFVSEVFQNTVTASFGHPLRALTYLWGAFLATQSATQVIIIISLAIIIFLLWHINRSIFSYVLTRRTGFFDTVKRDHI